ncbi:hypothetical protein LGH70_10655 [Hymenobacter sp. BT635]|uniref:Uncharacterized protein n=1 Tax=Hymenobacter nitidus TaxID=2880929 RepID=A0ABS8AD15_9BACT|nr:hypothetical protein [Hymenobacter nitidus]MCB2378044.1 hypothetical protein [Hymenobacter nitidus]
MNYLVLTALLLILASPLAAQRKPAAMPTAAEQAATALSAHVQQYYTDLAQRLREVYFAPSDGRAIALLSTTITEFTARKKALLAEAAAVAKPPVASPTWAQHQQALLSSTAAAKMPARRQRNPALDNAFKRFNAAQLSSLEAAPAATGE